MHCLNRLAQQVLLWTQDKFLSLHPFPFEAGSRFGKEMDLLASYETAQCSLNFSMNPSALGLEAMAKAWPRCLSKMHNCVFMHFHQLLCSRESRPRSINKDLPSYSCCLVGRPWFLEITSLLYSLPSAIPKRRDILFQARDNISSLAQALEPSCLASEVDRRMNAWASS